MFFLVFDLAAIASAAARIAVRKSGDGGNGTQVLHQHLLVVGYGLGGVLAFIGHRFRADEVAQSIGWPTGNPFQEEIAWANLGAGIVGLLCAKHNDGFWSAAAISNSVFYLGAALTHIRELRTSGNTASNNAGAILPDLLTPATTLALLWAQQPASRRS